MTPHQNNSNVEIMASKKPFRKTQRSDAAMERHSVRSGKERNFERKPRNHFDKCFIQSHGGRSPWSYGEAATRIRKRHVSEREAGESNTSNFTPNKRVLSVAHKHKIGLNSAPANPWIETNPALAALQHADSLTNSIANNNGNICDKSKHDTRLTLSKDILTSDEFYTPNHKNCLTSSRCIEESDITPGHSCTVHVGFADGDFSGVLDQWMYMNWKGRMSGPYTFEQLFKGYQSEFLQKDLLVYRVYEGRLDEPMTLSTLITSIFSSEHEISQIQPEFPSRKSVMAINVDTETQEIVSPQLANLSCEKSHGTIRDPLLWKLGAQSSVSVSGNVHSPYNPETPTAVHNSQAWDELCWQYEGADGGMEGPYSLWQLWEWKNLGFLHGFSEQPETGEKHLEPEKVTAEVGIVCFDTLGSMKKLQNNLHADGLQFVKDTFIDAAIDQHLSTLQFQNTCKEGLCSHTLQAQSNSGSIGTEASGKQVLCGKLSEPGLLRAGKLVPSSGFQDAWDANSTTYTDSPTEAVVFVSHDHETDPLAAGLSQGDWSFELEPESFPPGFESIVDAAPTAKPLNSPPGYERIVDAAAMTKPLKLEATTKSILVPDSFNDKMSSALSSVHPSATIDTSLSVQPDNITASDCIKAAYADGMHESFPPGFKEDIHCSQVPCDSFSSILDCPKRVRTSKVSREEDRLCVNELFHFENDLIGCSARRRWNEKHEGTFQTEFRSRDLLKFRRKLNSDHHIQDSTALSEKRSRCNFSENQHCSLETNSLGHVKNLNLYFDSDRNCGRVIPPIVKEELHRAVMDSSLKEFLEPQISKGLTTWIQEKDVPELPGSQGYNPYNRQTSGHSIDYERYGNREFRSPRMSDQISKKRYQGLGERTASLYHESPNSPHLLASDLLDVEEKDMKVNTCSNYAREEASNRISNKKVRFSEGRQCCCTRSPLRKGHQCVQKFSGPPCARINQVELSPYGFQQHDFVQHTTLLYSEVQDVANCSSWGKPELYPAQMSTVIDSLIDENACQFKDHSNRQQVPHKKVLEHVLAELQKAVSKNYLRTVLHAIIGEHLSHWINEKRELKSFKCLNLSEEIGISSKRVGRSSFFDLSNPKRGTGLKETGFFFESRCHLVEPDLRKPDCENIETLKSAEGLTSSQVNSKSDYSSLSGLFLDNKVSHESYTSLYVEPKYTPEKMLPFLTQAQRMLFDLEKSEQSSIDCVTLNSSSKHEEDSIHGDYKKAGNGYDPRELEHKVEHITCSQNHMSGLLNEVNSTLLPLQLSVNKIGSSLLPVANNEKEKLNRSVSEKKQVQKVFKAKQGKVKKFRQKDSCLQRKYLHRYVANEREREFYSCPKSDGCARSSIDGWAWRKWAQNLQLKEKVETQSHYKSQMDQSIKSGDSMTGLAGGHSSLQSARMNRALLRKLAAAVEGADILKISQLKARKKRLKFQRSKIHDWGVIALEPIDAEDFVIEYVGELIRSKVSDLRERQYERMGIGNSYLFRIDSDLVVDATKRGGLARFINHSCDPNGYTKIITVEGQKRIFVYAKRHINPGEELTYDYKFPREEKKIPCNCGSRKCRGSLN